MKLLDYRETLVLDVRGTQVELLIPHYSKGAQIIKQHHLTRPNYEYEAVMAALVERLLDNVEAPQFLDIGAFIGYYTVLASKLIGDRGRVWAIESNERHVGVLQETIRLNRLHNAQAVHAALSDCVEPVRSFEEEVWTNTNGGGAVMEAETCDALCRRLGATPNVAKMDVHGFEGKVLGGMRDVLKCSLEYLLLELHQNAYINKFTPGITRAQILDALEAAGFRTYYVAGHHYQSVEARRRFRDTGRFAFLPLTRENRGMLLFDRYTQVFILAAKRPLEDAIGPSVADPGFE
jgi:FkbM family methyltransferase